MFSKKFIISQIIFLVFFAVVFFIVRPFFVDLLLTNGNDKSPSIVAVGGWRFVIGKEKVNKERLPVLGEVASFGLTNSEGEKVSLEDLRGRVWVANFMFTTCSGICPMMTRNMGMIYKDFQNDDVLRFVSISVNPENDSPEVLKRYAEKNEADPEKWIFLTGSREDIQKLAAGSFKLGDIKEPVFHSSYFSLVDRKGRIRGYYDGTEEKAVQKLILDIARLRKEG